MRELPKPLLLRAKTIFLRTLQASDVTEAYVNWMNDPEVVQFTESRFSSQTNKSVTKFVDECWQDPGVLLLGIFDSAMGLHLGNIKLGPVNERHSLADVGIIIGRKEFWGRGIAAIAIGLVRDYAFQEMELQKLTAGCYATNTGSMKAFEKAGFSLEARRPLHYWDGTSRIDGLEYGCLSPLNIV